MHTAARVLELGLVGPGLGLADIGAVDLAAQAHQEKCAFLERLVALRALGPFVFLADSPAHPPLVDVSKAVYAIAVDGLSECVEAFRGASLHASEDVLALAVRILTRLVDGCRTASDRTGLLYSVARVLARHHINLQLAKIMTLGERVEDTFLVDGPSLQHNREQIEIETELLEAIAP